ncbi:MAG TPA: PAS domain S-box protein [Gaiellaceae bacterium]
MSVADRFVQASLLGDAVDDGPAAVFVADETGKYVAVNKAACRLVGYAREELLALHVHDLAEGGGRWDEMRANGTISGSTDLIRKDGSRAPFSYVAGKTTVAGMPVFVAVGLGGER